MAEDLLTRMDTGGIHRAVVHTAATAPAQVIPANNWALEIKERFDRFIPFGLTCKNSKQAQSGAASVRFRLSAFRSGAGMGAVTG